MNIIGFGAFVRSEPFFCVKWFWFFGFQRWDELSDIGKFIGIMVGRIQFAPTGMDVVMNDPMDIRFIAIGSIVEIYP